MNSLQRGGPLQGVRVVELTKVWAGPYIGKQLAFLGAEVIRVESLGSLDVTRVFGVDDINNAPGFKAVNPQKLSVQIDMKTARGIELILDLLKQADIVVENLRPGAIDRLGLGYEAVRAVKPDIVYVSMGMYGSEGPLAYQTGYAPCFNALAGLSALVGYRGEAPAGMNIRYADSTFGTAAAYAALVALLHRRRTGDGQFIDVSAVESMTSMIGDAVMEYSLNGTVPACDGNRHSGMAPHGLFACKNQEWLALAVNSDASWEATADVLGLADLAGLSSLAQRKAREDELEQRLAEAIGSWEAPALAEALQARGVAASKSLNSLDLIADPRLWMRGFYREVSDVEGQSRPICGPSWRMSRMAEINDDAPRLGQHNAYVLGDILGLSEQEQKKLAEDGVNR